MPIDNLGELRVQVGARGMAWRVRAVPDTGAHGLGFLPADASQLRAALELGRQLLEHLEHRTPGVLRPGRVPAPGTGPDPLRSPAEFDWRRHGVIGDVRDQGRCGSSVSFATTGLVGAQAGIELGARDLHLSESDQHFCSSHGAHCGGWNYHDALDQVRVRGVVTSEAFPYLEAFDDPPRGDPDDPDRRWLAHCRREPLRVFNTYKITNFTAHAGQDRKVYLAAVGPLVCGFTVYEDFHNYAGGVYRHVAGERLGSQAVLVVGYSDPERAWICRNSWGADFGGPAQPDGTGGGFFKIGYGDSGIDAEPFYGCRGVIAPPVIDLRHVEAPLAAH
jgi:hypothetical protein